MAVTSLRRISRTIHKSRWDRAQQGLTPKEIAKQDGVKERRVEDSIRMVELFRLTCSPTELEVRQTETLMVLADYDEAALARSLQASHPVFDNAGKKVGVEPDYTIQLEAVKEITKRSEIILGKKNGSGGVNVNVQNNVGVLGRSVTTFEDRLREIQQRRGLLPAEDLSEPVDVRDAIDDALETEGPVS